MNREIRTHAQFVNDDFVYISPVVCTSFSLIIAMHLVRSYLFFNISVTNLSASFYGLVGRVFGLKPGLSGRVCCMEQKSDHSDCELVRTVDFVLWQHIIPIIRTALFR